MAMKVHITCYRDGTVGIVARAEVPDSQAYGEWRTELALGQGIGQYTYAELRAHGSGVIEIDFEAQPIEQLAA
jgi:hypothetical protein